MPAIPPSSSVEVQPGQALGPLTLKASLYSTLSTLLHHRSTFPRLNTSFHSANPVSNPLFIELETNGVRLRFDGESQHLELIEVTEFGKLGFLYNDNTLSRASPPSFRSVSRIFGPTSAGELIPATPSLAASYILSWPGIAFKFPVPANTPSTASDKDLLNLFHKTDPPCLATNLVLFDAGSWTEMRRRLSSKKRAKRKGPGGDDERVLVAEIIANERISLVFEGGRSVGLVYGVFTAQDAITLIGPPDDLFTKSDTRLNIHTSSRRDEIESGPLSEAQEYFYNYFEHGLSLLFSPKQHHTLQKVVLHANLPQSHEFHRFHRLRWTLTLSSRPRNGNSAGETLTSEMNFEDIKTALERVSGPTGSPMIVNRGSQGSPSSSVELLGDDLLTTSPFGCTELFGFMAEGLVFEVIEGGWVSQVTCFKKA